MNIDYLRYALVVAQEGSVNKAAKKLLMSQSNLSKYIHTLEQSVGITLFDRTKFGMVVTPTGKRFLETAENLLEQMHELETFSKENAPKKEKFSIAVPRASYISQALARFTNSLNHLPVEITYMETNAMHIIDKVMRGEYQLGILRYAKKYERHFLPILSDLESVVICEFQYVLVMRADSPLSSKESIHYEDLYSLIEIAHADPYVPSMSSDELKKVEYSDDIQGRIFVYERASQFEILSENAQTYMWVSPIPTQTLQRYGLIQRPCEDNSKVYKDVLIHRTDYHLTSLDNCFITELFRSKRQYII